MKLAVVLMTGIVTIIGLSVPVIAQINRPSQDFFEQGREQIEREIQNLRESPTPENPQKTPEPVLKASPSPDHDRQPQPSPSATPLPTPTQ